MSPLLSRPSGDFHACRWVPRPKTNALQSSMSRISASLLASQPSRMLTRSAFSIVAVHGFRGHSIKTWSAHQENDDRETLWLKDFLALDMEDANIYTFGYPDSTPTNNVALDLVQSLDDERSHRDNFDVPIAFIAHVTGGFIVKQVRALSRSTEDSILMRPPLYFRHLCC